MVRLQVLGGVSLEVPEGGDAMAVLSHPKRLAVLTYLALEAPGGFLSRDRLLALFWPEAKETQGRNALNQVLHALRSSLGEGAIVTRGRTEVGVGLDRMTCDAVAFLDAVRGGRSETALDMYTGHLLQGFHLAGAPEFDGWLSEERAELREAAAGVAWTVAHGYLKAGCLVDAERTAQKAMGLVCTDESEVRRFIEALAVAGDRAGAIQFFERFRSLLDRELELEPGPRTEELLRRIREEPGAFLKGPDTEVDFAGPFAANSRSLAENSRSSREPPPGLGGPAWLGRRPTIEENGAPSAVGFGEKPPQATDPGPTTSSPDRREVTRQFAWRLLFWALACLAGGWASSEAAQLMISRFEWPEPLGQLASILIVMALFGFFFALILAFYFGERARGGTVGWELLVVAGAMLALGLVLSRFGLQDAARSLVESRAMTTTAEAVAPMPVIISLRGPGAEIPSGGVPAPLFLAVRSGLSGPLARTIGRSTVFRTDPGYDSGSIPDPDLPVRDAEAAALLEVEVRRSGETTDLIVRLLTGMGGTVLWEGEFLDVLSAGDLPTLRPNVVEAMGTELRRVLSTSGL